MSDTKQKILDAAERLIANQGYAATSLRQIIGEAGVNLASVHYHFGSKEELLVELIMRKVNPVNEKRLELLDRAAAELAPRPVPVKQVLEAFMVPMAEAAGHNPQFVNVMGRIVAEGLFPTIVEKAFRPLSLRFFGEIRKSVPELTDEEFQWRVQFMVGAMAHTMCGYTGSGLAFEDRIGYLVQFLEAGFLAPAGKKVEVSV